MTGAPTSRCPLCISTPLAKDVSGMKLCTNCDLLKGGVCNACKDYIALEAKISTAKQILEDLLSQRPKIRTRVNQNHDLLRTSVPPEIVCAVFKFCVPEKWNFDDFNDANTESRDKQIVSAPLLLGSICRTWRNIAWTTNPLWTLFRLNLGRLQNPNNVTLTREWLDRAGQLPLSIHIRSRFYRPTEQELEMTDQLLALVKERSEQWECLDIAASTWWSGLFTGGLGVAPNLQVLKLTEDCYDEFSLLGSKPSRLFLYDWKLDRLYIEWYHLTHVCLFVFSLDSCIELLRRAPNLVYCKLSIIHEDQAKFPIHDEPIIYPALETFKFDTVADYQNYDSEMITFFKSFIFPNLKYIKLESGSFRVRFSWDPVVNRIMNSCPSLTSLGILLHWDREMHPIGQCIIPMLQRSPMLRNLEMFAPYDEEWEDGQNELFKLLADTSSPADDSTQPTFLPNLKSVKFRLDVNVDPERFWNSVSEIFGPISDIHNPRRRPLKTLRVCHEVETMELEQVNIKSKDAVLQLLRLQQEGIVVDLKSTDDIDRVDLLQRSTERHGLI